MSKGVTQQIYVLETQLQGLRKQKACEATACNRLERQLKGMQGQPKTHIHYASSIHEHAKGAAMSMHEGPIDSAALAPSNLTPSLP